MNYEYSHSSTVLNCSNCGSPLFDRVVSVLNYFWKKPIICPTCKASLDWFEVNFYNISNQAMPMQAVTCMGAHWTHISLYCTIGELFQVDFAGCQIKSDAKILDISCQGVYSSEDEAFVLLEAHNDIRPRFSLPHLLTLFPIPTHKESITKQGRVHIFVTWIPRIIDDPSWLSLMEAFRAYIAQEYEFVIVPANVAVEDMLARLMSAFFAPVVLDTNTGKDRLKTFLQDGATYSHQLNVLLPGLLSLTSVPVMPEKILAQLNILRSRRNALSHKGKAPSKITPKEAAESLAAALLGYEYIKFVASLLVAYANIYSTMSSKSKEQFFQSMGQYNWNDYRDAGMPYAETDEGLRRWLEERMQDMRRGDSEFGTF